MMPDVCIASFFNIVCSEIAFIMQMLVIMCNTLVYYSDKAVSCRPKYSVWQDADMQMHGLLFSTIYRISTTILTHRNTSSVLLLLFILNLFTNS